MTSKQEVVSAIISHKFNNLKDCGLGNAPINMALCKYWGKRNTELNLPYNSSISVSLPYYTKSIIEHSDGEHDQVILNDKQLWQYDAFTQRVITFLGLFRPYPDIKYKLRTWKIGRAHV